MQRTTKDQPIPWRTTARFRAAIVAIAPLAMLAGYAYHPHIAFLPNAEAVAEAVRMDTFRWGIAHLAIGVASGLMILAFVAIRGYLRDAGEERWSVRALPFVIIGSTLYTFLPGMEFTVLAATQTGADIVGAQKAIDQWFVPIMMTSAVTNAIGLLGFARGISRSTVLSAGQTRLVAIALMVMAVARFVPLGLVQFYVQGLAGVVALLPISYDMWRQTAEHAAGQPRAVAAV